MKSIRCKNCNKLLFKADSFDQALEIRCPRCKRHIIMLNACEHPHGETLWKREKITHRTKPCVIEHGCQIVGYGSKELRVETISCWLARTIIQTKHYSRRFVNNSYLHLGVFSGRDLVGVLQWDMPLTPTLVVVSCLKRITGAIWS